MDRFVLNKTVVHEGRDVFGRYAVIKLEPAPHQNDWVWGLPQGTEVPIVPALFARRRRRVVLAYNTHMFNEIEHVGILRAARLRQVRVSVGKSGWPPYDGSSFALWQAVMPHVRKDGELQPYHAPKARGVDTHNPTRTVHYTPGTTDALVISGLIDYFGLGGDTFAHCYSPQLADLRPLVRARTLGWPPGLRAPLRLLGTIKLGKRPLWPHYDHINWPGDAPAKYVLREAGLHRMLDMLSILNFAAPAECYLAGTLHSHMAGHDADIALLQELGAARPTAQVLPFAKTAA